jgi:hypothetical protein
VYPAGVLVEVHHLDEIALIHTELLLRDALRNHISIVVDAENGIAVWEVAEELVVVNLVYAYATTLLLVLESGLLHQGLDQVLNMTSLVDEDVVRVLGS